jgi:hypothetical protein
MNRALDKKRFLEYLKYHPAAVKKLVNPTEEFLVECVTKSFSCMEYIPKDKQTEKVITAYLKANTTGYQACTYLNNNRDIAAKLPLSVAKKFITIRPNNIEYFPQATREMWVEAAKNELSTDFGNIPEAVLCEELIAALIENKQNWDICQEIPERFWTESLIKTALDVPNDGPENINKFPKSILTKKWVMYALNTGEVSDLEIPDALWDEELVQRAADRTGLDNIPERFRSKEVCLKSIYARMYDTEAIPANVWKDKDIQMAFVNMAKDASSEVPALKNPKFQIDALQMALDHLGKEVVKDDVERLISNIKECVQDWVPILKLWPEAIKYIDKPNQTTGQIQMALQSRTERDDLELIAKSINLGKVTRDMVPLLLNVEDADVRDFVTRKLAPPRKAGEADVNEVIVNVTPQEFNQMNKGVK